MGLTQEQKDSLKYLEQLDEIQEDTTSMEEKLKAIENLPVKNPARQSDEYDAGRASMKEEILKIIK